jgi:flagellar protein FlaG
MDITRIDLVTTAPTREATFTRPARPEATSAPSANGPERAPTTSGDINGRAADPANTRDPHVQEERPSALLRDVAREFQEEMHALGKHSLKITYAEDADRFVVSVVDSETQEVIRQIPPEALLEARRQLDELRGLLFDDRG